MEISSWDIYWLLMLDNFHGAGFGFLGVFLALVSVGAFIAYLDPDFVNVKSALKKVYITCFSMVIVLIVSQLFLPTTKQMAAIIVAPPIINNEKVQEIPSDLMEILGLSFDKVKNTLKEQVKEKVNEATSSG